MPPAELPFRNILVVTDFSETAAAALGRAVALSEGTGAKITLLHVLADVAGSVPGTSFAGHWRIPPTELQATEEKLRGQATERLGALVGPFRTSGRTLQTEVRVGVPFVETIRAVQQGGHDLVIAGTRGLGALGRILVGSTAERLVRKCPCPVWIVHPQHEWPMKSVLAPVDLTEVSGKSLSLACVLAERAGCAVTALYVFEMPSDEVIALPMEAPLIAPTISRRSFRKQAAQGLNEFVKQFAPAGSAVKQQLGIGTPWQVILRAAKRLEASLVVIGSVGRRGIPGLVIGNTAEKVLRQCDRSILAVKPDGFVSPVN